MKQITITKMQKFLIFASIGLWNISVSAQESEVLEEALPGFSIGGSVDTYFRTNFHGLNKYVYGPDGETPIAGPQAPATAFANDPGFAEQLATYAPEFEIYLQFDSFRPSVLEKFRGKDLTDVRKKAIDKLNALNLSTTLVVVLEKGTNDD